MKFMNILASFCFLTMSCSVCSPLLLADDGSKEENESLSSLLQKLEDKNPDIREAAKNSIVKMYDDLWAELLRLALVPLESHSDSHLLVKRNQKLAIELLGCFRMERAVPFAIKNITNVSDPFDTSETRFNGFPFAKALNSIGKPTSLAAVAELPKATTDKDRTVKLLKMVKAVEGAGVGEFMLKRAMETAETEEAKEAYSRALTVTKALFWIGHPVSQADVAKLPKIIADKDRTEWFLKVLKKREGAEVGEVMLKRAMETAETDEAKEAYSLALTIFKAIKGGEVAEITGHDF